MLALIWLKTAPRRWHKGFDGLLPKTVLHWLSVALLLAVFTAYAADWVRAYAQGLTNPNLQTDDARTALFPFHRYGPGAPLANDPIANEMIEYQPYAFRAFYWLTVPLVGLLYASKLAQGLCLLIVLAAGLVLLRSRRAGLGAALLFLFLFLRDDFVMNRIGGGLPRSFGFPAIALWFAGVIAHRPWARWVAGGIAALTYPSALAMVLGAEGLYALRRFGRPGLRTTWRRVRNYGLLVATCAALLAPAVFLGASDGGPVHTMEQAEQEPAFSRAGRLWLLPMDEAGETFGRHFLKVFKPKGGGPPGVDWRIEKHVDEIAMLLVALLVILPLTGVTPAPTGVIAFLAASLILYAVSMIEAFRLYSPERYYSYGMRAAALGLAASCLGLLLPRVLPQRRQPLRNAIAAAVIGLTWMTLGDGHVRRPLAMTIDYRQDAPLWEYIKTLPTDARIAAHIMDGDSIPLFAQRANNGGFETLQPWLTKSWARQKARAEDTLRAFYAADPQEVLAYARKYKVTHLLVNQVRYRSDFVGRSRSFQPLTAFAQELLKDRSRKDLVLARVPSSAVIFRHGRMSIVDVNKLAEAWRE